MSGIPHTGTSTAERQKKRTSTRGEVGAAFINTNAQFYFVTSAQYQQKMCMIGRVTSGLELLDEAYGAVQKNEFYNARISGCGKL